MTTSKYDPLKTYLDTYCITLTYQEIEEILGFKLPDSAYNYSEWWDNWTENRSQNKAWMDSGWKVVKVDLCNSITFQKRNSDH